MICLYETMIELQNEVHVHSDWEVMFQPIAVCKQWILNSNEENNIANLI